MHSYRVLYPECYSVCLFFFLPLSQFTHAHVCIHISNLFVSDYFPDRTCRLILLGKTGSGKSATGNTIAGENVFKSMVGINSETKDGAFVVVNRGHLRIEIMDTPGLADTECDDDIMKERIKESMFAMHPGPHALLIVIRSDYRFTEEEYKVYTALKCIFGETLSSFSIVVFTAVDQLDLVGESFEDQIKDKTKCAKLHMLLDDVKRRYILFDNRASATVKDQQVDNLMEKVRELVQQNGGGYFKHSFSSEVEGSFQQMFVNQRIVINSKKLRGHAELTSLEVATKPIPAPRKNILLAHELESSSEIFNRRSERETSATESKISLHSKSRGEKPTRTPRKSYPLSKPSSDINSCDPEENAGQSPQMEMDAVEHRINVRQLKEIFDRPKTSLEPLLESRSPPAKPFNLRRSGIFNHLQPSDYSTMTTNTSIHDEITHLQTEPTTVYTTMTTNTSIHDEITYPQTQPTTVYTTMTTSTSIHDKITHLQTEPTTVYTTMTTSTSIHAEINHQHTRPTSLYTGKSNNMFISDEVSEELTHGRKVQEVDKRNDDSVDFVYIHDPGESSDSTVNWDIPVSSDSTVNWDIPVSSKNSNNDLLLQADAILKPQEKMKCLLASTEYWLDECDEENFLEDMDNLVQYYAELSLKRKIVNHPDVLPGLQHTIYNQSVPDLGRRIDDGMNEKLVRKRSQCGLM